ncbi:MAG: O-methyltransferase [Methylovulum sp.]|jgi:caffeoyl-CoA O-methyltransferase|nr:O-methyltransferase [Methylovulum sp.]TSA41066.1 MAG: O-methyltransferase [Methylococcaceae bacterium]
MSKKSQSNTTTYSTTAMMVNPAIEFYQFNLLQQTNDPVISEMEALAAKNNFPIVGRLVGTFLATLTKMIQGKRVFEFGSGYGYSAYWFAKAVGQHGEVICTEADYLNLEKAQYYLTKANLWDRVNFKTGMAEAIFASTEGVFDVCYNDVDKIDYPAIWLMAKDRIRPGGLYIADNVLWRGRVAAQEYTDVFDGWTEAIRTHNALIFNDPDFEAFINPNRDGVLVARKKTE